MNSAARCHCVQGNLGHTGLDEWVEYKKEINDWVNYDSRGAPKLRAGAGIA